MPSEGELKLGNYRVLTGENGEPFMLGQGAMGTTYKAVDPVLDREVAIKLIKGDLLKNESARKRFLREAKAAACLQHPNVASIFEFKEEGDSFFYAMEFIRGSTLAEVVEDSGALPPADVLSIARQVSLVLEAAESKHLVHRDIKPSNIMLEDTGQGVGTNVKVIDFGLAKALTSETSESLMLTKQGFVGTPLFASPEQLEEKELDIRSDIYSLGVTLWYSLHGDPPFQATSLAGVIKAHLVEQPDFNQLEGQPASVIALLGRMLGKEPEDRHPNARALREEIERILRELRTKAVTSVPAQPEPLEEDLFKTSIPLAPKKPGGVVGTGSTVAHESSHSAEQQERRPRRPQHESTSADEPRRRRGGVRNSQAGSASSVVESHSTVPDSPAPAQETTQPGTHGGAVASTAPNTHAGSAVKDSGFGSVQPAQSRRRSYLAVPIVIASLVLLCSVGAALYFTGVVGGGRNREPIASMDGITVNAKGEGDLALDVLANDTDADGDALKVVAVTRDGKRSDPGVPLAGAYGKLTLQEDGTGKYVPDPSNEQVATLGDGQELLEKYNYVLTDGNSAEPVTGAIMIVIRGEAVDLEQLPMFTGLLLEPLPAWQKEALGLKSGAVVVDAAVNSPAALRGLRKRQIVTGWEYQRNGEKRGGEFDDSLMEFREALVDLGAGAVITMTVLEPKFDRAVGRDEIVPRKLSLILGKWKDGGKPKPVSDLSAADIVRSVGDTTAGAEWRIMVEKNGLEDPKAIEDLISFYGEPGRHFPKHPHLHLNLKMVARLLEELRDELTIASAAGVSLEIKQQLIRAMHGQTSAKLEVGKAYTESSPADSDKEAVFQSAEVLLSAAQEAGETRAAAALVALKLKAGDPEERIAILKERIVDDPSLRPRLAMLLVTVAKTKDELRAAKKIFEEDAKYVEALNRSFMTAREAGEIDRAKVMLDELGASVLGSKNPDPDRLKLLYDVYREGPFEDGAGVARALRGLAEAGETDPGLLFAYAERLEKGDGISKDAKKALEYYKKAKENGYPVASLVDAKIENLTPKLPTKALVGNDFVNSDEIVMRFGGYYEGSAYWQSESSVSRASSSSYRSDLTRRDKSGGRMPSGSTVKHPKKGNELKPEGKEYAYYQSNSDSSRLVLVPKWTRDSSLVIALPEPPVTPPTTTGTVVKTGSGFKNSKGHYMIYKTYEGRQYWESSSPVGVSRPKMRGYCLDLTKSEQSNSSIQLPDGYSYAPSMKRDGRIVLIKGAPGTRPAETVVAVTPTVIPPDPTPSVPTPAPVTKTPQAPPQVMPSRGNAPATPGKSYSVGGKVGTMSYGKGGAYSGPYWETKMRGFLRGKIKVGGESISMEQLAVMLNKEQGRSGYVFVGNSSSDRIYLVDARANGIYPSSYAGMGYGTPINGLSSNGKYLVRSPWGNPVEIPFPARKWNVARDPKGGYFIQRQ